MSTAVRISESLAKKAQSRSQIMHRSVAGQIEYWANIGEILESNPELSFNMVQEILIARSEIKNDELTTYEFTS